MNLLKHSFYGALLMSYVASPVSGSLYNEYYTDKYPSNHLPFS